MNQNARERKIKGRLRHLKSSIRDLQERHHQRHRPSGLGFVFCRPCELSQSGLLGFSDR
jgi:hypothetical protein